MSFQDELNKNTKTPQDVEFVRSTRDIDLLARNLSNNVEDMKKVFENIFSIECDDALRYHGMSVFIMAY